MDNLAFVAIDSKPISAPDVFKAQHSNILKSQAHDLLVQVQGFSINPIDTKRRQALTGDAGPQILGFDAVGIVRATGSAANFKPGDRVIYAGTTKRPGSYERFQVVDARICALAATTAPASDLAALPLVGLTAWELLFEKFHFTPAAAANTGHTILIINGAGGVGSMMTQLAHWAGLTTLATASPANFGWLREHGVDVPLDYHQDIVHAVHAAGYQTVDAVALLYAPEPYFDIATTLAAPWGHIGSIVTPKQPLAMAALKAKSISFDQELMFTKTDFNHDIASQGQILTQLVRLYTAGTLKSSVTTQLTPINLVNLIKGTALVESGHERGKVVLTGNFEG